MNLAVRGPRVMVRVEDQRESYARGVIRLEDEHPPTVGEVVACGAVHEVTTGDVVVFPPSAGRVCDWQGERYLVIDEDNLLMVIT